MDMDLYYLAICFTIYDLHHRHGYREATNYSKQTRLWDRLFGTDRPREELRHENIDYADQAYMYSW